MEKEMEKYTPEELNEIFRTEQEIIDFMVDNGLTELKVGDNILTLEEEIEDEDIDPKFLKDKKIEEDLTLKNE